LDTLKSILVFSHRHNSLNKEKLLENPEKTKTIPSRYTVDDFIKDPVLKQFYMYDMNRLLEEYEPGRPENKPILLEQIRRLEEERAKRIEEHNNMLKAQQKILSMYNPVNKEVNKEVNKDMEVICNEYEKKLSDKNVLINELLKKVKELTMDNGELKLRLTNT
jgi:hypothetical protein